MKKCFAFLLASTLLASSAAGQSLVTPNSITYTGTGVEFFPDENNMINGSGITGTLDYASYGAATHDAANSGNAWVTDDPGPGAGDYFLDSGGATVVFELLLGSTVNNIDAFVHWGYHFNSLNGNNASEIQFDYGIGDFSGGSQTLSGLTLTGANPITTQFTNLFNADRIRMTVLDNWFGGPAPGGDRVGFAEIRFTTSAIPEPSSAIVLLGLAGLAGCRRRR